MRWLWTPLAVVLLVRAATAQTPTPPAAPALPLVGPLPSTIDQWTMLVGILLPLGIAVVNRTAWGSIAKALAAVALCVLAAAGDVYLKGPFSAGSLGQNALAIFFLVVTTYHGFWKPTGITDYVEQHVGNFTGGRPGG